MGVSSVQRYCIAGHLDVVRRLYGKDAAVAAARSRGYTDEEVNNLFKANGGYLTIKKGGKHG